MTKQERYHAWRSSTLAALNQSEQAERLCHTECLYQAERPCQCTEPPTLACLPACLPEQGKRRADLLDSVLGLFPPKFHCWQLGKFPEPAAWLNARLAFTRTSGVWSMVGHMCGLGDRHGENILLDCSCGDVVQVRECGPGGGMWSR